MCFGIGGRDNDDDPLLPTSAVAVVAIATSVLTVTVDTVFNAVVATELLESGPPSACSTATPTPSSSFFPPHVAPSSFSSS